MKWAKWAAILVVALSGCGDSSSSEVPPAPAVGITVDSAVRPARESLPGWEDGTPRPLASITGEDGTQADFVENELWVATDDQSELDAVLSRWNGTVVSTFKGADAGISDLGTQYLIRVHPPAADASALQTDLRALNAQGDGSFKVSSQEGLNLVAAGSHEAARGVSVGINWVGQGAQQFRDKNAAEAPTGDAIAGVNYTPNAFQWPSHSKGSPQDIGVAEAWRALDLAGKLGNRVKLAVLDMGFQPDSDWRAGWFAFSNVPLTNPTGTENLLSCSGGSPCPWHGTMVVSTAMALADNGYGSAGTAGPVADPIVIFTLYDFFTSITALGEARILGAKIANMSYGAPVPWYLAWSVLPFEAVTAALRATGMLLFAAAGNDGKDVDAEGCTLGVCWERTWYTPCENSGVICVGGLRGNSTSRASGSNYGKNQVDIFAPYTLWVGPTPDAADNRARSTNGTSFSSPFASGVAALIWAAKPSLSADAVENILLSTAHPSPDSQVKRYVNALGAVQQALGNVPPAVAVTIPANGTEQPLNLTLSLEASVEDFEEGTQCCTVTWTSNVDGPLGEGHRIDHAFTTEGTRTVTVVARDSANATTQASTTFSIVNSAPTVTITKPVPGEEAFRNTPVLLRGLSFDLNEPNTKLACDKLMWTSSDSGDPLPVTGCQVSVVFATNGVRTLTLTGMDPQGATGAASVDLSIVEPPPNLPPQVEVTSPADHAELPTDQPITLSGTAMDPENETPLTYEWTVKLGTLDPVVVGNEPTVQWTPSDTISFTSEGTYTVEVRLTVTDPEQNVGTDYVVLEWLLIF